MREKVRATHGRGRGKLDMNLHFLCTSDPFATDVRSFSPPWSAAASTHRCCISEKFVLVSHRLASCPFW